MSALRIAWEAMAQITKKINSENWSKEERNPKYFERESKKEKDSPFITEKPIRINPKEAPSKIAARKFKKKIEQSKRLFLRFAKNI